MMRRYKLWSVGLAPVVAVLGAVGLLSVPRLQAQPIAPATSDCATGLSKTVDPSQVQPGDTARVTMVITHTCADYRLPMDMIFLVDVSNSMTRGSALGADPGTGKPTEAPGLATQPPPDPIPPEPPLNLLGLAEVFAPGADQPSPGGGTDPGLNPGAPSRPGAEPSGCEGAGASSGISNPGGTPTPEGPPLPGLATPSTNPGSDPGAGSGKPANDEAAGTEDLIREARAFIREFIDQPAVQKDLTSSHLRLGLVSFNERGRRLVSLSSDGKRIANRLGLLRGSGKTRIDLGLRTAERTLLDKTPNRATGEKDRTRVIVVVSDGQFCSRDLRVKVDKRIDVVTLAAGRSANLRKMRDIASETEYALTLRDMKELMFLYTNTRTPNPLPEFRPVKMTELTLRDELSANIQLVAGSPNPAAATINGQKMEWVFPMPSDRITVTYDIKPQGTGSLPISAGAGVEWKDSEARPGKADFPAVNIEVVGPPMP